ncbi:hypothetical protein B0O99DRAFT_501427, partial [Bisporella sp. PMI_857]
FCNEMACQLTGPLETDLWKMLVLQSSETEPSIRHAVTAIGALNLNSSLCQEDDMQVTQLEFAYKEYGLAIVNLRKYTLRDNANICTKLIACILFAYFESFHGNSNIATSQVYAGIDMLTDHIARLEGKLVRGLHQKGFCLLYMTTSSKLC